MMKIKCIKNKKAIFFTIDALIALIIILFAVLVIYPAIKPKLYESELSGDIIKVLSSLKIGEINNPYVTQLRSDGRIKDSNKTILEQIGEFYVTNITIAKALAESVLSTINTNENIGLWYGGTLLASKNSTSMEKASNVEVDRQIISGIQRGSSLIGFSAIAYLTSSLQKKYFYFGGYIGDGNISVNINYNGSLNNIDLEVAANTNFSFCILNNPNPLCCGAALLEPSPSQFEPKKFPLSAYSTCFSSGDNIIKFYSRSGKNLFFAGGFIKITYNESAQYEQATKYFFPGIEGLINIYDGFYSPGQINEMEISLYYKSNYTMFLNIGNVTVFNDSSDIATTETISNANLISKGLVYSSLSNKTIPIRLGLENLSQVTSIIGGNADVILITDVSGSMNWRLNSQTSGTTRNNCSDPLLYNNSTNRISLAKCLDKNFTATILTIPGNRVGLVSFDDNLNQLHVLSDNLISLAADINTYDADGGTCICCGINAAYNMLNSSSNSSRQKFIVVMSDGGAGYRCTNINSCLPYNARCGNSQWTLVNRCFAGTNTIGSSCTGGNFVPWECNPPLTAAMNNTIWSSNRAYVDLNANVSSVGFFLGGCFNANYTLSEVARVGGGIYKLGNNAQELFQAYSEIALSIVSLSYVEQTANVTSNFSAILYPDSYIKFEYVKEAFPYGLITTSEEQFTDDYTGSFSVPADSNILETKVISYSGPRWTDNVKININSIYKLSNYGNDYTKLGDPYAINIPNSLVLAGDNIVNVTTGTSPTNISAGSRFNKIIYTLVKETPSYSNIAGSADGCIWNIEFNTGSPLNNLKIPETATDTCYYNSTNLPSKCMYYTTTGGSGECEDADDAVKVAIHDLLKSLDYNSDGKLDVNFAEQDLKIDFSDITGIPYPYSTEVQVRKWD